ncbi:MAG TPA: LTA synthase family protein [Sphingobacteriaceae bacterium]|nr:LTA synthase family protein [Sphingobacteriaceae bacterium]
MDSHYLEEPEYPFFNDLKKCIKQFVNFSIALWGSFFLNRLMELWFLTNLNSIPQDINKVVWVSLLYDLILLIKILPIIFIPFVFVFFNTKSKKTILLTFGICATLILSINLLLIKYYATALVPLGADLFGYTVDEIVKTTGASMVIDEKAVLFFLLPLIIFWTLLFLIKSGELLGNRLSILILIAGSILLYIGSSTLPSSSGFKSEYSYNLTINKFAFFTERSFSYFTEDEPAVDIYASNYYEDDGNAAGKMFNYITADYPFLHTDETEDVLTPFFKIDSTSPPNIVIIQVEGLGRAFSGYDAPLGSFTPFLDELATKSLYFQNFLASQGRTFASLPSIMGSLPFADKGFSELAERMPPHLTLPRILKKSGYTTRFYSGVDLAFDNENIFLEKQGFDHVVSEKNFDESFSKSPAFQGFTWGYADRELIVKTLQDEKKDQRQPFMLYMQTVSMHNPFLIPNQGQYIRVFENHLNKLGFDNKKKDAYRKYKNIYSTILYSDQALNTFFKEYSKLPSYANTIFIITGDHRLPEIPLTTKIDRYHVPLIIYSPLLKRSASIRSVSSHFDITPSLLVFLKKSFGLTTPSTVAWVGSGLDTARTLRNIHKFPVMQTKNNFHNIISGLYFLDQNNVYLIGNNMKTTLLQDENKLNELRSAFNQQKSMNERFSKDLKLLPDSIFSPFR